MEDLQRTKVGRFNALLVTDARVYRDMADKFYSVTETTEPAVVAAIYSELLGKAGFQVKEQASSFNEAASLLQTLFARSERLIAIYLNGYSVGAKIRFYTITQTVWTVVGYTPSCQVRLQAGTLAKTTDPSLPHVIAFDK